MEMENETCWNYSTNRGGKIKENDGGGEFNYDIFKKSINATMYPQYNN
jgi:hypothetical protein